MVRRESRRIRRALFGVYDCVINCGFWTHVDNDAQLIKQHVRRPTQAERHVCHDAGMSSPDAAHFDQWYADMGESVRRDDLVSRTLGLPPELQSSSPLSWDGIAEVADAVGVGSEQVLVDLACGRGGYGFEVARRTGARLIGVDFSVTALRQARTRIAAFGLVGRAEFRVGRLDRTGLDSSSADAVMCVDAVQFAQPTSAALDECRRVLQPGGRLVLTCWESIGTVDSPADDRVPLRLRRLDLARELAAAGFERIRVQDRPAWRAAERDMWQSAVELDAGDDPALRSMQDEGTRVLATFDAMRRVLATATTPG